MAALLAVAAIAAGCDSVHWEGLQFSVEKPARPPRPESEEAVAAPAETALVLPSGPVLFHVRRLDRAGHAWIQPVVELADSALQRLGPRRADQGKEYARRFADRYYGARSSYTLYRGGGRAGTFVVTAAREARSDACPRLLADGQLELRPAADTMTEFLAWPEGVRSGGDSLVVPTYRADMVELSAILADRTLRERAVPGRWAIRRPVDLRAVVAGGGEAAFAATFLVGDSLGAGAPPDSAGMAFLVADYTRSRGYAPLYFDADWYGPGGKRVLRWLDRMDLMGDATPEWILRGYGDATLWYEVVGRRGSDWEAVWSSRDPVCEARSPRAGQPVSE